MAPIGGVRSGIMSAARDAIPDTGKEYNIYDIRELSGSDGDSISTVPDQEANDEISGSATLRTNGANGEQYLEFSTSQSMDVQFDSAISQPYEFFIVAKLRDLDANHAITDGYTRNYGTLRHLNGDWLIYADGTGQASGEPNTNLNIHDARFDDANDDHALLVNNSEVIGPTGGAGSANRDGHTIAALGDDAGNAPLDFYYMVFFEDELTSNERQEWYGYINGIYG